MSNPQQPELARSRKTPAQDPDAAAAVVEGQQPPGADAPRGPIPPENQPGHRPEHEQDKPDLDAFAERMGIVSDGARPEGPSDRAGTPSSGGASQPDPSTSNRGPLVWAGAVATAITLLGLLFTRRRRRSRRRR